MDGKLSRDLRCMFTTLVLAAALFALTALIMAIYVDMPWLTGALWAHLSVLLG